MSFRNICIFDKCTLRRNSEQRRPHRHENVKSHILIILTSFIDIQNLVKMSNISLLAASQVS